LYRLNFPSTRNKKNRKGEIKREREREREREKSITVGSKRGKDSKENQTKTKKRCEHETNVFFASMFHVMYLT